MHLVLFDVHLKERAMSTDTIELVDLGDASEETKQFLPIPAYFDSTFFRGLVPDIG